MKKIVFDAIPETIATMAVEKLNEVKEMLAPYLHTLAADEERRMLRTMNDKSYGFVLKVVAYCQQNPGLMPSYLEFDKMNNDFAALAAIRPLLDDCTQLKNNIEDTMMLAGTDVFAQCLLFYNNVKLVSQKGDLKAAAIADELDLQYPGRKVKIIKKELPE